MEVILRNITHAQNQKGSRYGETYIQSIEEVELAEVNAELERLEQEESKN